VEEAAPTRPGHGVDKQEVKKGFNEHFVGFLAFSENFLTFGNTADFGLHAGFSATGTLLNTATVSPPEGIVERAAVSNSDTDINDLPALGFLPESGSPTEAV